VARQKKSAVRASGKNGKKDGGERGGVIPRRLDERENYDTALQGEKKLGVGGRLRGASVTPERKRNSRNRKEKNNKNL